MRTLSETNMPGTVRGRVAAAGPRLGWPRGLLWCLALSPVLTWLAAFWYARLHPDAFIGLTKEDGWVENSQVVLFLLGAVFAGAIARTLSQLAPHRGWTRVYSLAVYGLIWVSGEEVSWGQRIFGWRTPEWLAAYNLQGESNFHNLVGLSWFIDRLMYAGVLGAVLLVWVLRRRLRRGDLRGYLWIPHPVLIPALLCYLTGKSSVLEQLTMGWYPEAQWKLVTRGLQEVRELLLAFAVAGFFIIVFSLLRGEKGCAGKKMRDQRRRASPPPRQDAWWRPVAEGGRFDSARVRRTR